MAVNPMQRKAHNSFLLGVLVTVLIAAVVIGILFMQIKKLNEEKQKLLANRKKVYVMSQELKSGDLITSDMFNQIEISASAIPADAITVAADLSVYNVCDKNGNPIEARLNQQTGEYEYILINENGTEDKLMKDSSNDKYYKMINGQVEYVEFSETPLLAKIDVQANTIITSGMLARGQLVSADMRRQEYNVIILPTQLVSDEYIDVRLRLPSGQDYIVVSHKQVEIPMVGGTYSKECIWMNLTEDEILTMSSALVETYRINGAKLYATRYVEAGMQAAATTTYVPSAEVVALIQTDPNVVEVAKQTIANNYRNENNKAIVRNPIDSAKNNADAENNLESGVKKEIAGLQSEREEYLDSLGN